MGAASKITFNNTSYDLKDSGIVYLEDTFSSATTARAYSAAGFNLHAGSLVFIKFTNSPIGLTTININSTGAKSVYRKGVEVGSSNPASYYIYSGETGIFMYDGTKYNLIGVDRAASQRFKTPSGFTQNTTDYSWSQFNIRKFGPVVMFTFRLTGVPKKDVNIISGLPKPVVDIVMNPPQFGWLGLSSNTGNLICTSAATASSVNLLCTLTYLSSDVD